MMVEISMGMGIEAVWFGLVDGDWVIFCVVFCGV